MRNKHIASAFFAAFGAVMTGALPKSTFLQPWVAMPLAWATGGVIASRLLGISRSYFEDPKIRQVKELTRSTSWEAQCLIDPNVPVGCLPTPEQQLDKALKEMFKVYIHTYIYMYWCMPGRRAHLRLTTS